MAYQAAQVSKWLRPSDEVVCYSAQFQVQVVGPPASEQMLHYVCESQELSEIGIKSRCCMKGQQ